MTISEAIREADRLKPNGFETEQKLRWLERLEKRLRQEILLQDGGTVPEPGPFGVEDLDRPLQLSAPFDEMYVHWLCAQMDYYEREFGGFNAANALFEAVYGRFRNAWNAAHPARGAKKRYC